MSEEPFILTLPTQSSSSDSSDSDEDNNMEENEGPEIPPLLSFQMTQNTEDAVGALLTMTNSTNIDAPASNANQEESNSLIELAKSIKNDNNDMFNEREKSLMETTKNTSKYERSLISLEKYFFSLVNDHSDEQRLKALCQMVEYADGLTTDYRFYQELSGEKSEWKRVIINRFLVIFSLRCENRKDRDKPLDSSTFAQKAKELFCMFRRKGIL